MNYGYIRVSTDKQTVENQRFEILQFCQHEGIKIDGWIEETVSGGKAPDKRKLGLLLKKVQKDDMIICSELSRLGRSLYMVLNILSLCMEKGVAVRSIKDNFTLGDDIQSKVLAFAFGLSAQIERNLISQRTKMSLDNLKSSGKKLGRPFGAESKKLKLSKNTKRIRDLLDKKVPKAQIARIMGVQKITLRRFIKRMGWSD